ncbi:MAG TPA: hypothetical protein VFI17_13180 [Solirubrobacterales bacterium]|nr:hypothetical protein [Solirubrobacterales bacterium]
MIRNVKALGLALIAVFAMSAMVASAAQAENGVLDLRPGAAGTKVKINGAQVNKHVFTVTESNVECNVAEFQGIGEYETNATTLSVHPVYTGCTAFGFLNANVNTENCNYEGMANGAGESTEEGKMLTWNTGEIKVVCSGTNTININAAGVCEASVGSQTIANGLKFTNTTVEGKMDFDIIANKAPVKTKKNLDGFGCPFKEKGETTGEYTGPTTIRCFEGNTPVDCTIKTKGT